MRLLSAVLLIAITVAPSYAKDWKITRHVTTLGNSWDETIYVSGSKSRMESTDPEEYDTLIFDCESKQRFELKRSSKSYYPFRLGAEQDEVTENDVSPTSEFFLDVVVTSKATGRKKRVLGYEASEVVNEVKVIERGKSAPSPVRDTTTVGWYIDLPVQLECGEKPKSQTRYFRSAPNLPRFEMRLKQVGSELVRFPVELRQKRPIEGGSIEERMEVTWIEETVVDPAIFEVPKDYKRLTSP